MVRPFQDGGRFPGPALESLAERALVPVRLLTVPDRRLPALVERTAYFVTSKAIANAAKHAAATEVTVEVCEVGAALWLTVADDGVGGADPHGSGLRALADRVAAADGRLTVTSPPARGTRLTVVLPLIPELLARPRPR
ncbi:hypothetical protein Misp01_42960 [Microtetraspora sp. NBRC 13810]|uniref:ATP-binding protein n=1 Tax=Microtetraspora sp. NBRC 13810 TaxID=3030990 RepID=UPI0024A5FCED|nr:ATP-binding protein [Microtetraspora sp. NBRC 13810]GLW09167.1 hypothetical protein Misp01_42960 [Microtetraspora sp. NBRC 13810]